MIKMPDFPRSGGGATPAEIWTHSSRKLTELVGQPRIDLMGEDDSLESGSGMRKQRIDDTPAFLAPIESSVIMDGSEKTLFEITDVKPGEVEAWVDLTQMGVGDTIIVRYRRKVKAGGSYIKYAEETYSGVQSLSALCIFSKKIFRDLKITAQQTLGSYKTIDCQFIRTRTV